MPVGPSQFAEAPRIFTTPRQFGNSQSIALAQCAGLIDSSIDFNYFLFQSPRGQGGQWDLPSLQCIPSILSKPDTQGAVCDQLLTRTHGHSALELPLITSYFGHSGAVVHGATTSKWLRT